MNIMQLLAQAAGSDAIGPDVTVQAESKRTVPEDDRVEPGPRKTDELIQRKGMFGIKGTLRDVLGAVGDAFLTQSGNKQVYAPQREREKLSSALYGMTDDPKAAIERATIVDPGVGVELNNQYQNNETRRMIAEQQKAVQQAAISQKGYGIAGSLARTIKDPESYKQAKPILDRMKASYGLDFDVPDEYDENALTNIYTRGLSPDQIADNERADMNFESQDKQRQAATRISQERAGETARHNRAMESRPTGGSGPKNPTNASIVAPLLKKLESGGTLTPAQKEVLDRAGYNKDRGKGRRAPPPLPPGFSLKSK